MNKQRPQEVTDDHPVRKAIGYGRQAKVKTESARYQRAQLDYARAWVWEEKLIEYVNEDFGVSGTASTNRPGFRRILGAITAKRVGAIFVSDLSRLSRDAHTFFAFFDECRRHNVLLVVGGCVLRDAIQTRS